MQVVTPEQSRSPISIRRVKCASLLHELNFRSSQEYTANFYRGCTNGCTYCYAPSLVHDARSWGYYVDAKVNAPDVLRRELRRIPERRVVFLSSASDPYQPVEARFRLTERCLEVLLDFDFPVVILTRSPLVLRDLDLLRRFSWVRVGCSISTVSARSFEPGVVSVSSRIATLRKLRDSGIVTWVSMAPVIPQLVLHDVDRLLRELKASGVHHVALGMIRFIGYEESRKMFEQRTGKSSDAVTLGGDEMFERMKSLVRRYGLDNSSVLDWKEDAARYARLDDY